MKTYLHSEFINENLLTEQERQRIDAEYNGRIATIEKKYTLQQQDMMQKENALYDRLAKEAGFSGYSTGENSYESGYDRYIKNPKGTDDEMNGRLRTFTMLKILSDEYADLVKRGKQAVTDEREEKRWEEQLRLNKVLECIHTRTVPKKDSDGKHIIAPRTYNMQDDATKDERRKALTQIYNVKNRSGEPGVNIAIDRGISEYVTKLWQINVRTNASCSGMVSDHPYHRREEDDRFGRWKRGDLEKATATVNSAYLSIPYKDNHPELLKQAADMSRDWGWTTENRKVYGEESLVFYPPHTLDGTDYGFVLHEAGQLKDSFIQSGEAADEEEAMHMAMQTAERMRGGVIHYTDRMLDYNFRCLAEGMTHLLSRIRMEEHKNNIKNGKAVNLYRYDSGAPVLSLKQLEDVFRRSGIELDTKSVNRPLGENCIFVEKDDKARLMAKDEPELPWMMVKESRNLSYLMAGQVKNTPSINYADNTVTVMVHPDPKSAEEMERFTVTKRMSVTDSYHYFSNKGDMSQFFSNNFTKELYQAAQTAHDNSLQKKTDDHKSQTAVSEIRIRKGMDNNMYISCKVFGEQQLSKRMNRLDVNYYNMRMNASDKAYNTVAPELAAKYYAEEIDLVKALQQKEGQGMKRK